ncbi:peroxisomal 2 4-dienoyl-CoA reductase sps19 [Emydomyces testavorans]|uniref:2,4-dienoyl-CoA reductase [(3E)-enoyl-CoA-producing] n=1 Tax=Emydomyces testavorans TaxID=2070801 RepID=A0AAF0DD92_9EURO|nr:peroxisomal 2 4-dienoyl-CoA reductase sps19 [Emydomyces testavorans]
MVHLGANACIVGRSVEKTEQVANDIATARPGSRVMGIGAVDVRRIDSLKNAVDRCVKELGGIDFVIAGAAGNFLASIEQLSVNAFKSVIDIDVLGSYNTLKATLPHLLDSAAKHKSDGVTRLPLQTHVSVAKAGVDSLSNNVALEYGPFGITSNVISPGPIGETEGMRRLSKNGTDQSTIPLGRNGTVKEIADATVYLFSDSGNYVTGSTVVGA